VWREIYSRRKAFIVTTALALVIVVGGLGLAAFVIDADGSTALVVGVVDRDGAVLEKAIEPRLAPDTELEVEHFNDQVDGEDALRSGDISALVVGRHDVIWGPQTPHWVTEVVASAMRSVNIAQVSEELSLSQSDINRLLAPVNGRTIDYEEGNESVEVISAISVIVMFIAIISYGQWIAYGVVEEKANRVAELVLGALTPSQLLTAKMISLGGMGLLQMVIVGFAGVLMGSRLTDIPMPAVAGSTMAWLLLWFVFGYAFYGSLYAAAGSLAADSQEAGSVIAPLNIVPGIGYVVGLISLSAGSEVVLRIFSMIPIWAPMVMPGRMAQGSVPWWEIAVALALMVVSTFAMVRLAARVYLGGITQATRKVGWRQAFRGGKDLASA
jgi:ABC-2 type transport system permease protein